MIPKFYEVIGQELAVVWSDGHESYYPLESLRRSCPCAGCSGEPDLFGRIAKGPDTPYQPSSFEVASIERTGNYGMQINWADGHIWGIWTFDRLRDQCPCPEHGGRVRADSSEK